MNKYRDFHGKGQFRNDPANSTGNHDRDTTTQKVQGRSFTSIHADSLIVHSNPITEDPSITNIINECEGLAKLDGFYNPETKDPSHSKVVGVNINDRGDLGSLDDVGQTRDVCQQINVLNRSIELQIYRGDDDAS